MIPTNAPKGLILGYFFEPRINTTPHVLVWGTSMNANGKVEMQKVVLIPGDYEETVKKIDTKELVLNFKPALVYSRYDCVQAVYAGSEFEGVPMDKYLVDMLSDNTCDKHGQRFTYRGAWFIETIQHPTGWEKKYTLYFHNRVW